jgi:hypothetical protein
MTNIYVLELAYSNGTTPAGNTQANANISSMLSTAKSDARLQIRTGYFGYCVRSAGVSWLCSSDAAGLLEQFGAEQDPLNIIWTVTRFQDEVLFTGLMQVAQGTLLRRFADLCSDSYRSFSRFLRSFSWPLSLVGTLNSTTKPDQKLTSSHSQAEP